jgi:hypothetical protein
MSKNRFYYRKMATKRKLEDEIEGKWTPESEKKRPAKKIKLEEGKKERKEQKFIKAFNEALAEAPDGQVRLRVVKKIRKSQYPWLERDIEVGEIWIPVMESRPTAHGGIIAMDKKLIRDISDVDDVPSAELPMPSLDAELAMPLVNKRIRVYVFARPA